jgi:hypothetical protein
MTEIGIPDPVEPAIEIVPASDPVPGPLEVPLPQPVRTPGEPVPA